MSRKRKGPDEVELNLAAMLDMAFQLLAFFVMTFQPAPVEAQVDFRMPKPSVVANTKDGLAPGDRPKIKPVDGYNTLTITLAGADADRGRLGHVYLVYGAKNEQRKLEVPLATGQRDPLHIFRDTLHAWLNDPGMPFEQVIISVDSNLHYDALMGIIDVCSKQSIGGSPKSKLTKLSIVEST